MDEMTKPTLILASIVNSLLLITTLVLGVIAFFSILDILITITTYLVITDPLNTTVREIYVVATVRNFWIFFGGALLLGFLVGGIDYHTRRLGKNRTTRILFWTFAIESIFIIISWVI